MQATISQSRQVIGPLLPPLAPVADLAFFGPFLLIEDSEKMTGNNDTIVRTLGNILLTTDESLVLQRLFERYARVVVEGEFGMGLSGCRVFRVRPVEESGVAHTPALVKIGPLELIDREWLAYETWVKNRLPRIAWVTSEPIIPRGSTWGGLQYELVGGGIFEVRSLSQYYRVADVADLLWVLQRRLFPVMGRSWWLVNRTESSFQFGSDYDHFLPVNLIMRAGEAEGETCASVSPARPSLSHLTAGDRLRVEGFHVTEIDESGGQLTLNLPPRVEDGHYRSMRVRVRGVADIDDYRVGALIQSIEGTITDTRHTLLEASARAALAENDELSGPFLPLSDAPDLPNPLHAYQEILHEKFLEVNLSTIHGDFNLENILVDPETRDVKVIDFATVRQGHALHDLLRLETELVTKVISELITQHGLSPSSIRAFYDQLHLASFGARTKSRSQLPHRALEKPFAILVAIRQEAAKSFFNPEDYREYYYGLILYLLGALKFKNLDALPNAKRLSLLAAATCVQILEVEPIPARRRIHLLPLLGENKSWRMVVLALLAVGLLLAAWTVLRGAEPVPVANLCKLDRDLTVAIRDGPNSFTDLDAYFAAANPDLYAHLAAFEQSYLEGQTHKGLTYIWGSPGVGKTFVSTRRLKDKFPGDNCLVKLGDLFGDEPASLGFEVIRKPSLVTLDERIVFDDLPTVADLQQYDLNELLSAAGCRAENGLVPLIIVDDLDEIHPEASRVVLRSIDRLILQADLSQQRFLHAVVLGRAEGFSPWYQDPARRDDDNIVPLLNTFRLAGPEFATLGDVAFLADNQNSFERGEQTWQRMKEDGRADEHVEAYLRAVARHPFLTYNIRALSSAGFLTDRAVTHPDEPERELKAFLFEELLRRGARVHGRPLATDEQYMQLLEEVAVQYAGKDQLDEEGFFSVGASDTVEVTENGSVVGEVLVRRVLDHSGVAILKPASYSAPVYRFEPVWVHAYLVERRNERLVAGHAYQGCSE
jgi:hypothetical protein